MPIGDATMAYSEGPDRAAALETATGSEPDAADPADTPGPGRRLLTRFALLAFGFYHVPLLLNDYPSLGGGGFDSSGIARSWGSIFGRLGLWIAQHVFGLTEDVQAALSGDNGDTAEEYCRLLLGVVVAAIAAAIWTFADRRRPRARWVDDALQVLLRYAIALGLASYALAKIYPIQFSPLSPSALETRVGELEPMSLAWSFMQYSRTYSLIAGVMELTVVILLCFRRTATIGALICIPVMLNVMLINLCYGVVVKLFSMVVVLSAIVLVLHEVRRLVDLLVRRRATLALPLRPPFRSRRWNRARWVVKLVAVGGVLVSSDVAMRGAHARRVADRASPLFGTWEVVSFVVDGRDLARTAEPSRWRRLMVPGTRGVALRLEDDTLLYCRVKPGEPARTAAPPAALELACTGDKEGSLRWTRDGDQLHLEGTFGRRAVMASLRRRDLRELPLLREPFRWIFDA